jgi:hypothetical protein
LAVQWKIVCTKQNGGVKEHIALLKEQGLSIPPRNPNPKIIITAGIYI